MIKKHEVLSIIRNALEELDGIISDPKDENCKPTIFQASVEEDKDHNLIFLFKEDVLSDNIDIYKIKVELL